MSDDQHDDRTPETGGMADWFDSLSPDERIRLEINQTKQLVDGFMTMFEVVHANGNVTVSVARSMLVSVIASIVEQDYPDRLEVAKSVMRKVIEQLQPWLECETAEELSARITRDVAANNLAVTPADTVG